MNNQPYKPNGRYEDYWNSKAPKSDKSTKAVNGLSVILLGIFTLGIVSMLQHIADGMKGRN